MQRRHRQPDAAYFFRPGPAIFRSPKNTGPIRPDRADMDRGLLIVAAIFALYFLAARRPEGFGFTENQSRALAIQSNRVVDPASTRAWSDSACAMINGRSAKASCSRLASMCSPVVGELVRHAHRLRQISNSTGMAPSAEQLSVALRAVAEQAPLCGSQLKIEGTTYASAFAKLMQYITNDPAYSLATMQLGPDSIGGQLRPYLLRLGVNAPNVAAVMEMISNMAYLIPTDGSVPAPLPYFRS